MSRVWGLPRYASFAGVGIMGFGVQLAVLQLLTTTAGLTTARATAIAVEAAVLHNFVWHERWTWRDRAGGDRAHLLSRLARFHAGAAIVSLAGNVAITVALVESLHMPAVVANTCAVGVLSALNFRLADRWVFSGHRPVVADPCSPVCWSCAAPPARASDPYLVDAIERGLGGAPES